MQRIWTALMSLVVLGMLWGLARGITQVWAGGSFKSTPSAIVLVFVVLGLARAERRRRALQEEHDAVRLKLLLAPKRQYWGRVWTVLGVVSLAGVVLSGVYTGREAAAQEERVNPFVRDMEVLSKEQAQARAGLADILKDEPQTWEAYVQQAAQLAALLTQGRDRDRRGLDLLRRVLLEGPPADTLSLLQVTYSLLEADQVVITAWLAELDAIKAGKDVSVSEREVYLSTRIEPLQQIRVAAAEREVAIAQKARDAGVPVPAWILGQIK